MLIWPSHKRLEFRKLRMRKSSLNKIATTAVFLTFITTGCSTISGVVEEVQFPRDTAIIIGKHHYLINTYKCAEARNIDERGVIDCYAVDGAKSTAVAPLSNLRISIFEKHAGFKWASEEHQALLYDLHYQGGKERLVGNLVNSVALVYLTVNLMKDVKYSTYESGAGFPIFGTAPELNNMSIWDAREYSIANWQLHNASFYHKLGNGITLSQDGGYSKQIGNLTFYSEGTRSYQSGNFIYNTNGVHTRQVTDRLSYSTDGTSCITIGNLIRCDKPRD